MPRSVGVEEELLLVDPATGVPVARSGAVLASAERALGRGATRPDAGPDASSGGEVVGELQQEQVETDTRPCTTLAELDTELRRWRRRAAAAAREAGSAVAALATSPLPVRPTPTTDERYEAIGELYAVTAEEQLTCGCHVHVAVDGPDEGVAVVDRLRPWLPVLIATSASSPFWQGRDTRYASYRTQSWDRWPVAGPTELFGSVAAYRATVADLIDTGALLDERMLYFDARVSAAHPTVEVRVGDVGLDVEDAVLHAALVRALVETAARETAAGVPPAGVRTEVLRLARWRASRSGLDGALVHPVTGRAAPAAQVVDALLGHVADALDDAGDTATVRELLAAARARGGGAGVQRAVAAREQSLAAVVADAVRRTEGC